MMGRKRSEQIFGALFATTYAALITGGLSHQLRIATLLSVFAASWIVIYFVGVWIERRREDLDKKIPVSGKELRRRRKQFYDWLASQGRRW
jgi:1,4-dihydroxy-2-naphthoate octaprenyltransferase